MPGRPRPAETGPGEEHSSKTAVSLELSKEDVMATEERETGTLIGSDKVEGTAVYGADESQIGSIERVMIDKRSGKVSYAVLSFGGFLGIGDDYYPLPWESLKYDTGLGGYRTGITEKQLQGAPKFRTDKDWSWEDHTRTRGVNEHYGVVPT
jgi:PRC-barrel domain